MHNKKIQDIEFGTKNELIVLSKLRKYFKSQDINKTKDKMDTFDFVDRINKTIFELKTRRIFKNQYYDIMMGYNKILDGLKHIDNGYRVFLCWDCKDKLCFHELTKENFNKSWLKIGGRYDRGKDETNMGYYVPTKEMTDII
jgi:hypothetical protein